jgi:vitamin B12 transporter
MKKTLASMLVLMVTLAPRPVRGQDRPFLLDGLVVTASPTPRAADVVGRSVTVLDGTELRARGLVRVTDALRNVPGVAVVRAGSFGAATSIFLRGGESDYVQVLVISPGVRSTSPRSRW